MGPFPRGAVPTPTAAGRVTYFKEDQINRIMFSLVLTYREPNGKSGTKNENKAKEKASALAAPRGTPVSRTVASGAQPLPSGAQAACAFPQEPAGCFPAVTEARLPPPAEVEGGRGGLPGGMEGAGGLLTLPAFWLSLPAQPLVAAW